jgi:hypothetical protein
MNTPALLFPEQVAPAQQRLAKLVQSLDQIIFGRHDVTTAAVVSLVCRGHMLFEGLPGLGKTELVRGLAQLLDLPFRRIQFTPDLMPSDITGSPILQERAGSRLLVFQPGPIFTSILLADEINRASPKTQSALLEAMQERCVTVWDWLNGAEFYTPAEQIERQLAGYENVIANKKREEMIAYAPDGKQLFGKFADANNDLPLTPQQSAKLEGATLVHNHPTDAPPSLADAQLLLTDAPAAIRLAGPGKRQQLQPPADLPRDYAARVRWWRETALPTIEQLRGKHINPETARLLGRDTARQLAWEQAWPEIVRALGLRYSVAEAKR